MNEPARTKIAPGSVLIGLDWAKAKHDYCLLTPEGERESGQVEHDDLKLREWLDGLAGRFPGRRLCLCMEDGREPLLWRLEKRAEVDLFVVNTATAAEYRKTFAPSGDKNDRRDAASILDLLRRHPEKMTPRRKPDDSARALHRLCLARRRAVDRRTGVISALREVLELHYPVASKLFEDFSRPIALAFLKRWPEPDSLRRARESTLAEFFREHRSRSETRIRRRLDSIAEAVCPTDDPMLLELARMRVREHVGRIQALNEAIDNYDRAIRKAFAAEDGMFLFSGLPGAGDNLAPRLLAAFRLVQPRSAEEMQTVAGIAPIRVQSGQSMKTYMRRRCPKFLRQSFHEFAGCSVKSSAWAKAFYEHQTQAKGKGAQAAKRALAFKWVRVLFACWKQNRPYNEAEYIAELRKRNSPLADLINQK